MIKLGDKVRFVNENMQGVVTSIKGNTAGVTIEDDFEIPVLLSEIVKITDVMTRPEEDKPVTARPRFIKVHSGFHIAFEKVNDDLHELKFHNSESDLVMLAVYENATLKQTYTAELEQTITLGRFSLETFNKWPEFIFLMMPLDQSYQNHQLITRKIRFGAKEFHSGFSQCYFLGKQAYHFRLDQAVKPAMLEKLKQHDFGKQSSQAPASIINLDEKPGTEVDLHAQHLVSDPGAFSPKEIIDIQINAVQKTLEMAHVYKMSRIVFIHGVGNHFLKNKIRNLLSAQKNLVQKYEDADMLKYGGGATEVWLN